VPNLDPFHNGRYIRSLALRLAVFIAAWAAVLVIDLTATVSTVAEVIILAAATAITAASWYPSLTVMILQQGRWISYREKAGGEVLGHVYNVIKRESLPLDDLRVGKNAAPDARGWSRPYLHAYRDNTGAYITSLSRQDDTYISWTFLVRLPPYRWLYQAISDLGRGPVRQTLRNASARSMIEAIHGCVLAGIDAALAEANGSRREPGPSARPRTTDVLIQIYLADGRQHAEVEDAVTALMSGFGIASVYWEESVAGSWYRRIWGQVEQSAPPLEEVVPKAVRAVEMKTLLSQQAGIDAAQGDALAKLISALAAENSAVIQMGSMLLVKAKGVVMARNLTQLEMIQLERNPALMRDPDTIIQQLRDAGSPELVHAGQLCTCGSGFTIAECTCML
jgi:hypothetical protein